MPHRAVRREACGDVAGGDGVDRAIDRRQDEERIRHLLAPWRKNAGSVQREIGPNGEDETRKEAREHRADASKHTARRLCLSRHSLRLFPDDGKLGKCVVTWNDNLFPPLSTASIRLKPLS